MIIYSSTLKGFTIILMSVFYLETEQKIVCYLASEAKLICDPDSAPERTSWEVVGQVVYTPGHAGEQLNLEREVRILKLNWLTNLLLKLVQ